MRRVVCLPGVVLIAAAVLAGCSGFGPEQGIGIGQQLPDLTLWSLEDTKVSLRDYAGSVMLVNLWATWCLSCQTEVPVLERVYRAYKNQGFVVVGIDVGESGEEVAAFAAEKGMTYPLLLDELGTTKYQFRVLGLPVSILADRDGVIRFRRDGELSEQELLGHLRPLLSGSP